MDSDSHKASRPKARQSLAHVPTINGLTENATADIAALQRAQDARTTKQKLRGKSIGPGGLEALTETSGNALKIDSVQLKSILKPVVPLTPPKVIPSFDELRSKRSTSKLKSPAKAAEELLIDFSTPGPGTHVSDIPMTVSDDIMDPFSPVRQRKSTAAVVEPEAAEEAERKRKAEKQAALEQRAARRKSMANRRVSFAPEATLHTWSVMEMAEDSTTSSASNSTRIQSTPGASSPVETSSIDRPEAPPEQVEEPQVLASPAPQRDLHQKKRRRQSSNGPEAQLEGSVDDDDYSSSPSGDVLTESSPVRIDDSADSDSDIDGDTAMIMEDPTSQSMGSQDSEPSTQSSLDERLRQAASQAGTRGIAYDEHGEDMPMEMATATITQAFQPWVKNTHDPSDKSAMQDQENVNPFSSAFKAQQVQSTEEDAPEQDETQDMSMDVTGAVGGILAKASSPAKNRRKSVASRRRSSVGRRRSSGGESAFGDETMDFTTVGGGILSKRGDQPEEEISDEELTMEFTAAVGGVIGRNRRESAQSVRTDDNETMDITAAVGSILPPIEEQTEPQTAENTRTAAMEMTKAVGGILGQSTTPQDKARAKHLMQEETDAGQLSLSPASRTTARQIPKAVIIPQGLVTSIASETGSPDFALKPRLSGRSRQSMAGASTTPKFSPRRVPQPHSPPKTVQQMTPTKQLTPLPARAETPNKTPIIVNVTHRGASPKKLFKEEIKAKASPASIQKLQQHSLFSKDEHTGRQTPSVVLQATRPRDHRRRSSGVGIDQEGYGSPQITEMLDRRESIGESAAAFKLASGQKGKLRFEDPRQMEQEVDAERALEERRESGRFMMEEEANEQQEENATLQLKEMIDSMTPKKSKPSKLKGRKSLAVGAARGLLGKRPAELDLDEDEDGESSPKRLKAVAREGSPVKKVHLPKPPSKEETTGRLTRAQQQQLANLDKQAIETPALAASPFKGTMGSPQAAGRYRDVPVEGAATRPESFEDKLDNVVGAIDISTAVMESNGDEKISLQKFLNMTNIHFIELSTTKRRQTMAQSLPQRPSQEGADSSIEGIFSAAATTLPLLELYQHATRELKSYISTGRKIIRSIETETLTEQPPLFREYVDARPDVKLVMDNQFRNGKTNARLQSREGWYTWRTQLIDGLKAGLDGIRKGMEADLEVLVEQQRQLDQIVPDMMEQHRKLQDELTSAAQILSELDSVDTDVFDQSRQDLRAADEEHLSKLALLTTLRQQMTDKEEALNSAEELKTEMQSQIAEADRVRQEHRGWPVDDVLDLKAKVDAVEKQSGWRLAGAEEDAEDPNNYSVALTLIFRNELRLFFYPAVFQMQQSGNGGRRRSGRRSRSVSGPTAPISLTYAPVNDEDDSAPLSNDLPTEKRFFLQLIRSQLQALSMIPKGSVSPRTLLTCVSNTWDLAAKISQEIRLLNLAAGITSASIVADDKLSVRTKLILPPSRIDVEFTLSVSVLNDGGVSSSTTVSASGVYGDLSALLAGGKVKKVQNALIKEVESGEVGTGAWIMGVRGLERWLQAQQKERLALAHKKTDVPSTLPPTASIVPEAEAVKSLRSPLAVKKVASVQKRALPIPKKPSQSQSQSQSQGAPPPPPPPPPATTSLPPAVPTQHKPMLSDAAGVIDKENIPPPPLPSALPASVDDKFATPITSASASVSAMTNTPVKVAMDPVMQEELMRGSPVRRVGALRRSPV